MYGSGFLKYNAMSFLWDIIKSLFFFLKKNKLNFMEELWGD